MPCRLPSHRTPPNEIQGKTGETPSDNELFVQPEPTIDTESLLAVQQRDPEDDDDTTNQGIVDSVLFGGFISNDDNDEEAHALDTGISVDDNNEDILTPVAGFSPPQSPSYQIDIPNDDHDEGGPACPVGISTDDNNEVAPAFDTGFPFLQTLTCPAGLSTQDREGFSRSQIADQPRLLIDWPLSGRKIDILYWSCAVDKWWYAWEKENPDKPNVSSHIGRIMETELGVQLFNDKKCTRCQNDGLECWVYSEKGVSRVKFAGTNCTRCRALPVSYGCSHAKRRRNGHATSRWATNAQITDEQAMSMMINTYVPILPKNNL